ncbi:MAG: glycoside hydrolase family 2 TIM barrel-domain containing protein, partial [Phycisphaerales bacterium]
MRRVFTCCICSLVLTCVAFGGEEIDLTGQWNFKLDSDNVGIDEQWFLQKLPERITLPGSLQEQGYGDRPSANTQWTSRIGTKLLKDPRFTEYINSDDFKCPFWLTPDRHYVGKAWYQREVNIPENWQGKRIVLQLERPHWKTTVWVDGNQVGSRDSLGTAHDYDLSDFLKAGKAHALTICVDNRYVIPVGKDAHSISDQTQSNWNGITGRIVLAAGPKIWIDDAQVYPDVSNKSIKVNVKFGNSTDRVGEGVLAVYAESFNTVKRRRTPVKKIPVKWNKENGKVSFEYDMGDDCLLWDEYQPALYRLILSLKGGEISSIKNVTFGMRKLDIQGTQFSINGRNIFIRGTLECCIFPMHGYPPTDIEEWKRIIRIAKAHGLNHFRFHSWCPPEAAFAAADEEGFYLQAEGSCWAGFGDGTELDKWIYDEIYRMIKAYGNHPSFCFFSPSNEPSGRNRDKFLGALLESLKVKDNRRFYVAGAGWPQIKENQYSIEHAVRLQRWKTLKFDQPPQTFDDYREHVNARPVPVIGHEIGQWCVYPDLDENRQYPGVLKAKNMEIFRDKLQKAGMGH